jgi:glycosyltransferase involved in cell wall biosynthesis
LIDKLWQKTLPIDAVVSKYLLPSQSLCTILTTTSTIPEAKAVVLLNTLDNRFFTVATDDFQPLETLKPQLLYVGRLSEEKGVHVLLKALSLVPEHFELTIVGEGKQEPALQQQAIALGISHRLHFVGKKTPEQVVALFRSHWVSVLPCQWFEIFGLTVAESMALGCPVIASNLGAMPELLGAENTSSLTETTYLWAKRGILFQAPSAEALSHAILALWQNPERYQQVRLAGWQWAADTLQSQSHQNALFTTYDKVLS